jgi:DNA repair ATPase RecN
VALKTVKVAFSLMHRCVGSLTKKMVSLSKAFQKKFRSYNKNKRIFNKNTIDVYSQIRGLVYAAYGVVQDVGSPEETMEELGKSAKKLAERIEELKKSEKTLKKSTEKLRKVQQQTNELVEEAKSLRENPNREESVRPLLR